MKTYGTLPKLINRSGTFQTFLTFHVPTVAHALSHTPSFGLCDCPPDLCPSMCSFVVLSPGLSCVSPAPPLRPPPSLPTRSLGLSILLTALYVLLTHGSI